MASHYVKRMLPLVDVVILLFGFMTVILMAARLDESPTATSQSESKPAAQPPHPEIANTLIAALLEKKRVFLLEIDKDLQISDENGVAMGNVDKPSAALLQKINSVREAERLVLCQYPAGFECSRFDPERQRGLKELLGKNNVVYLLKTPAGGRLQ